MDVARDRPRKFMRGESGEIFRPPQRRFMFGLLRIGAGMARSRPEEFADDLAGDRLPTLLRTPLAGIEKRQSAPVGDEDREFAEPLVTVHPVKSLADRGNSKRPLSRRNVLGPRLQPLDVLAAP